MAREAVLAELGGQGGADVRLVLLLAVRNADKAAKPAAFEQRLAMMWAFARDVRAALEEARDVGGVAVDVALSTQPFFHDKSAAVAESGFYKGEEGGGETGTGTETEQVILAGYDTLIRIFDPKYYGEPSETAQVSGAGETPIQEALGPLFQRARLRVTMRTDDEWGGRDEQAAYVDSLLKGNELEKIGGSREWVGRIEMVEGRKEGEAVVSSTLAREAAKAKDWERLGELVSPEVRKWVEREQLYGDA